MKYICACMQIENEHFTYGHVNNNLVISILYEKRVRTKHVENAYTTNSHPCQLGDHQFHS